MMNVETIPFVEDFDVICGSCHAPNVAGNYLCVTCLRALTDRAPRESTLDPFEQAMRADRVAAVEAAVPVGDNDIACEVADEEEADALDGDYEAGGMDSEKEEDVEVEGGGKEALGKRKRAGGNRGVGKHPNTTWDKSAKLLRFNGGIPEMRDPGSLTQQEWDALRKSAINNKHFADGTNKKVCCRQLQAIMIIKLYPIGTSQGGMAYKYGRYAAAFMDPTVGGFRDRSEFALSNEERAKEIAWKIAVKILPRQSIKVGQVSIKATKCSEAAQTKLKTTLAQHHMHGFYAYCLFLPEADEILAQLRS